MVRIRTNLKKGLKRKFLALILLLSALFVSYFLVRNTDDTSNRIKVKEINIGVDNEK